MADTIHTAMIGVMRDLQAIGKDQTNKQQGFRYRGIDQVYNAVHPLLAKHGIFCTPEVLEKTREERPTKSGGGVLAFTCLRIKYTFYGPDGSSVACVVEGEGMDSGDKSSNKAMAVAHKYAILQTFCIPTQDMPDPDAEVHELASRPQRKPPAEKPKSPPTAQHMLHETLHKFVGCAKAEEYESVVRFASGGKYGAADCKEDSAAKEVLNAVEKLNADGITYGTMIEEAEIALKGVEHADAV